MEPRAPVTVSLPTAEIARRTIPAAAIAIAFVVFVAVFYYAASAFFIVLGALLVATIFDGLSRPLQWLGLPRAVALAIVFLLFLAVIAGGVWWSGATVANEASALASMVREQANTVLQNLEQWGVIDDAAAIEDANISELMPSAGVVSSAGSAVFAVVGGLGNVFIVLFLAAFIAWQPVLYRNGFVSLFPKARRARIADTIEDSAHALRMWIAGDVISMLTVFTVSWLGLWLIGMPYAFLLAVQAGLLAFIPTLGAFVAGLPIILTGLSVSPTMALYGLGVYILIQFVESNVTTPIAQRFTTSLPPALTLGMQLLFGLLFGLAGVILAVPAVAILLVVVNNLYIDDALGGPYVSEA